MSTLFTDDGPPSPCIGFCTTSSINDEVCQGCGRTDDEVLRWNISMKDDEKWAILKRLGYKV